jgi:DNA-binding beta-propeller fold protein YncE
MMDWMLAVKTEDGYTPRDQRPENGERRGVSPPVTCVLRSLFSVLCKKGRGMAQDRSTHAVGAGSYRFEALGAWGRLPEGWSFVEAVGVATDSHDRVFVFNRGEHPVIVLDPNGSFLNAWGEGHFVRPHGIQIGPDDMVYLTDDRDHTVRKYTPDGRLLWTLGTSGRPSDTGIQGYDFRTIAHAGPPFNLPTNLALGPDGELFISDGYGNARVHKFAADGRLLLSWGEPGDGPGQFNVPHGIAVDRRGRVVVADRENSRLQLFTPGGDLLAIWTNVVRPCDVFVDRAGNLLVAELGKRAGMFPWMKPDLGAPGGRVSVFDPDGVLLSRWGGGDDPTSPADFYAPHDLWLDSQGSLYVAEVVRSAGGFDKEGTAGFPTLRKFRRGGT